MFRKQLRLGFFFGFLAISLFGCGDRPSDQSVPNRNQPNMNGRTTNSTNGNMMNSNSTSMTNANSNTAVVQDNFWTTAAQGGMAEVELGKLAAQKATNPEVKKFAQMMVTDHTKANEELKALAAKKNVTLPADMGSSHKSAMEDLAKLSGADFDKKYVEMMVDDHEEDVEFFDDKTSDSDADIKAFASKTLPTLQKHLEAIKAIQSKMK
jgi:putative membrane protein